MAIDHTEIVETTKQVTTSLRLGFLPRAEAEIVVQSGNPTLDENGDPVRNVFGKPEYDLEPDTKYSLLVTDPATLAQLMGQASFRLLAILLPFLGVTKTSAEIQAALQAAGAAGLDLHNALTTVAEAMVKAHLDGEPINAEYREWT